MSFPSLWQVVLHRSTVAALAAIAMVVVPSASSAQQSPPPPPPPPGFGLPLPGLTSDQLAAFDDGRDDFQEVET